MVRNSHTAVAEPICSPNGTWSFAESRVAGDFYGADPIMGDAIWIICSVYIYWVLQVSDYAAAGDGHDVTCLRIMM